MLACCAAEVFRGFGFWVFSGPEKPGQVQTNVFHYSAEISACEFPGSMPAASLDVDP